MIHFKTKKNLAVSAFLVGMCFTGTTWAATAKPEAAKSVTGKSVVATVEGNVITLNDVHARIKTFPPQYAEAFQNKENRIKVLDQLIDEKVLLLSAKKAGIQNTAEFKNQLATFQEQLLFNMLLANTVEKKIAVSDAEVQAFYTQNPQRFQAVEERKVRHILVKTDAEAKDVLLKIKAGGDFATLAKQSSQDSTAANGGDLGWVSKGQMVPEFEQAAFALNKDGLSDVVKTQFGFHLIKADDIRNRPELTFDQVKAQIKEALLAEKKRVALADYLASLKKTYKIKEVTDNI